MCGPLCGLVPPQGASYRGEGGLAGCWPSAGLDGTRRLIESEDGAAGHCSVIGQESGPHVPPEAHPPDLKIVTRAGGGSIAVAMMDGRQRATAAAATPSEAVGEPMGV